ncbi:PREDICTED: RNA-binding protein 48 [Papilio xuthus]|uniref:RNA-binding protein 48 n=1 Tax=Papilio xuthus TaxID=66420 RepID=A0AAJ6ZTI9_PAPXU|nr:PREDICTED: RNA-binding protein 48 [Papilio xuthus]
MNTNKTENENKIVLPHHEQQPLCTNRLPYRQGRKLTAVKVYTIANESNHLLIFGVPSLNLRQETKALFMRFGKLLKFNISTEHPAESFTETYHAQYERIQSSRIAKRMLDTKNFYGGSLHVCYAPEMESIEETKEKILQRQRDVLYRLRNLQIKEEIPKKTIDLEIPKVNDVKKLNMGEINTINLSNKIIKNKRKKAFDEVIKKYKPCFMAEKSIDNTPTIDNVNKSNNESTDKKSLPKVIEKGPLINKLETPIQIVDCTSADKEIITNINEHLNYDKFGNEDIRRIRNKPVNKIVFNFNKKS